MNNIIKEFNDISIDFLTQTSSLVGSSYLYKYKLMTKINCVFAIDLFIQNVLPFKNRIVNRDETFFLNKSVDNYMDDVIGIKNIYHTLDKQSRNNIWEIVLALIYLAEERYIMINNKSHLMNIYN
jgi:predicted nucleic acid-binding OB-fold protein